MNEVTAFPMASAVRAAESGRKNRPTWTQDWLCSYPLADGPLVRFRHTSPADAELVAAAIQTVSRKTLQHRFFSSLPSVSLSTLRNLLDIEYPATICILGVVDGPTGSKAVCGARFFRPSVDSTLAEFALTVHDDYQHRGLGTFLMQKLAELARPLGVEAFEGYVLHSNFAVRELVESVSIDHEWSDLEVYLRVIIPIQGIKPLGEF